MVTSRRIVWTSLVMGASLAPALGVLSQDTAAGTSAGTLMAAAAQGGEGGEGGGEGGEGGVDFEKAALDPVVFLTALDVIRAHYLSGRDAYVDGHKEAGAQMFAHPIGEIYVGLAPVIKQLGIADFEAAMQSAVDVGSAKGDAGPVLEKVNAVLVALDVAAAKAPRATDSRARVEALVLSDILNRAALQYSAAQSGGEEAKLDGYGLYKAAALRAETALPLIASGHADAAQQVRLALTVLSQAFPKPVGVPADAKLPETATVLATVSKAALALSGVR